jgi:hypothetical protein
VPRLIAFGDDIGQIKVGDVLLPGVFESLEITGTVKLDQVEIPGKRERVTQAVGFENTRVRLTLYLVPETEGGDCSEEIAVLQQLFRESADQERPGVYRIVNRHCQARNVDEVIFSDLKTFEDNRSDKVLAILEFIEHVPIKVQVVEQAAPAAGGTTPPPSPAPPAEEPAAPPSPAQDVAAEERKPGLLRRIWNWLRGRDEENA